MSQGRWKTAADDVDFAPYLADVPAATVEMFQRFVALPWEGGPVTFELQRDAVVLRGTRRIFASVRPSRNGLSCHLNLTHRVTDRRHPHRVAADNTPAVAPARGHVPGRPGRRLRWSRYPAIRGTLVPLGDT